MSVQNYGRVIPKQLDDRKFRGIYDGDRHIATLYEDKQTKEIFVFSKAETTHGLITLAEIATLLKNQKTDFDVNFVATADGDWVRGNSFAVYKVNARDTITDALVNYARPRRSQYDHLKIVATRENAVLTEVEPLKHTDTIVKLIDTLVEATLISRENGGKVVTFDFKSNRFDVRGNDDLREIEQSVPSDERAIYGWVVNPLRSHPQIIGKPLGPFVIQDRT